MIIAYFSLTGQTRRFVSKLSMNSYEVKAKEPYYEMKEDFILISPAYDEDVTSFINKFIEYKNNQMYLKGVAASGNRNFAADFAFTGVNLAKKYNVPLLHCYEFSGTDSDVNKFKEEVKKIEDNSDTKRK